MDTTTQRTFPRITKRMRIEAASKVAEMARHCGVEEWRVIAYYTVSKTIYTAIAGGTKDAVLANSPGAKRINPIHHTTSRH